jgi:hypothetical protein
VPDVTSIDLNGSEDFIIIACDGLWDTVTMEEATTTVFNQLRDDKGTMRLRDYLFIYIIVPTHLPLYWIRIPSFKVFTRECSFIPGGEVSYLGIKLLCLHLMG